MAERFEDALRRGRELPVIAADDAVMGGAPYVTMRVPAPADTMFAEDFDTLSVVGRAVPLLIDDVPVRSGLVVAATVVDGGLNLEVELANVPTIWQRLHDDGKVSISIAVGDGG